MLRIEASTPEDLRAYQDSAGYIIGSEFRGISARSERGTLLAVIGFDHWTPSSAQIHSWISNPMALREHILTREVFKYIFVQSNRSVVFGVTPAHLSRALSLNKRIGLKEIYRVKDGWDLGVDMVIQEMRKETCGWIEHE